MPRSEESKAKARAYSREYHKAYNRYRFYKLMPIDIAVRLWYQGFRCPICEREISVDECVVDHDHSCCPGRASCGKCIRGLLCRNCNEGLGNFKDNPISLWRAFMYLAEGGVKPEIEE